jgi:F0F1-type ATP synthase delta subunit
VDPTLIGGVVTRIGDVVFDGSLRNRLVEMRHHMLAASSTGGRA